MYTARRNIHTVHRSISKDMKASLNDNIHTTMGIVVPLKPVNKLGMKGIEKIDTHKLSSNRDRILNMPLKKDRSVVGMLHMKRLSKKGFYSNRKEDDYHRFASSHSPVSHKQTSSFHVDNNDKNRGVAGGDREGQGRDRGAHGKYGNNLDSGLKDRKGNPLSRSKSKSKGAADKKGSPNRFSGSKEKRRERSRSISGNVMNRSTSKKYKNRNLDYFNKDLTFTPTINQNSKDIDSRRGGYKGYDRIEMIRMKGATYMSNRNGNTEDKSGFQSTKKESSTFDDDLLPLKSSISRKDAYHKSIGNYSEIQNKDNGLSYDDYIDIRLNSIRKSIERDICNRSSVNM